MGNILFLPTNISMNKLTTSLLSIVLLLSLSFNAQNAPKADSVLKNLSAIRVSEPPKIDGKLDDECWRQAPVADDFVQYDPKEGAKPNFRTEVRVVYDDKAVYISAMMYDNHPDSILRELGNRDDDLNADYFEIKMDTYNKHLDAFHFIVWASGVQSDSKESDETFNAIWESAVKILDNGWSVEMKIPYSAIRFPKNTDQTWSVQFLRSIRRTRELDQWSYTPKDKANYMNYWGNLNGISNIKTPLRLSFTPYGSVYFENAPANDENGRLVYTKSFSYSAGADIKYGIDRRFTLDMTLLPDFGQVQSDNRVKNLTPFEIVLDENRPFFKESFELFNRDRVFYTRRIGRTPSAYYDVINNLKPNETIVENPSQVKLLNAVKVSGRTNGGLGIGEFNAVTDNTYATIKDSAGNSHKILTEPLTDYNVLVFDQNLKNNSDIYIINAATIRTKNAINANVTSIGGNFQNKQHSYEIRGGSTISQRFIKNDSLNNVYTDTIGKSWYLSFSKISGNFRYTVSSEHLSSDFDKNDLGLGLYNNYRAYSANFQYNIYKPFWRVHEMYNNINFSQVYNYKTGQFENNSINFNSFVIANSHWGWDFAAGGAPSVGKDFYEPRVAGRYYITPTYGYLNFMGSAPYENSIACDFDLRVNSTPRFEGHAYGFTFSPILKFSDRLSLRHNTDFDHYMNDVGFANFDENNQIIFGKRDIYTIVNTMTIKYIFKNDMSLSLRFRHYLSNGVYNKYYTLLDDGSLQNNDKYAGVNNFNSNYFNIDLVYSWQFAPGSALLLVYKNSIDREYQSGDANYFNNLHNAINAPQTNSVSLKILYYLDYQYLVHTK